MSFVVTQRERTLLTMARFAVGLVPVSDVQRTLTASFTPPGQLGPNAQRALADTLSRGMVQALAREGAWFLEGGRRGWERWKTPPELQFTGNTVRLLSWLISASLLAPEPNPLVLEGKLTPAEDALVVLLLDRLRGTGCDGAVAQQLPLRALPLSTLAHVEPQVRVQPLTEVPQFDIAVLAPFLESLRPVIARGWSAAEERRRGIESPEALIRLGQAQEQVANAYLAAIETAERPDLATFWIDAALSWVTPNRTADDFARAMSTDAGLRERTEGRRRSAAMLRTLNRLREWDQRHRGVRFIDDGYDLAQRLLSDWGRLGERGFSLAADWVRELDALPTLQRE